MVSSRIHSEFGTLGERVNGHHGAEGGATRSRHVEVFCDPYWQPGLLVRWIRSPEGWKGLCAWVSPDEDVLRVDLLPSDRFRPLPASSPEKS